MAKLYFDDQAARIWPGGIRKLPIPEVRRKLYEANVQRLIPFLGAGASLKSQPRPENSPPSVRPTAEALDRLCVEYGLADAGSRRFLQVAIQFAQLLAQRQSTAEPAGNHFAPSSGELARQLAQMLELEPLRPVGDTLKTLLKEPVDGHDYTEIVKSVADLMGLSRSIPPLLTVASYFNEDQDRPLLRDALLERLRDVNVGTDIQDRVVDVAKRFVDARNSGALSDKRDYVIITTNYDRLLEQQLEQRAVPTCVVTVKWESGEVFVEVQPHTESALKLNASQFQALKAAYDDDDSILLRAGEADQQSKSARLRQRAQDFKLINKSHSLVMIYKIHGCPVIDEREAIDNIVISDQDYVRFIQGNGRDNCLIPLYVRNIMGPAAMLFLGYSFSDWNVRSLYRNFVKSRYRDQMQRQVTPDETTDRDYVVLRSFESGDDYFFRQWDVSVLVTELDKLARQLAA